MEAMSITEVKQKLSSGKETLRLIDIRSEEEYKKMHIPVAINIPAPMLETATSVFNKNELIVCVCNKGHERSQNAATFLSDKGFDNAYYLEGGTLGWFTE